MPTKMLIAATTAVVIMAILGAKPPSPSDASPSACRGPDAFSAAQIAHLQSLMVSTNADDGAFLRDVHLPREPSSAVGLVTADSVCSRAVQAWTALDTVTTPPLTRLYVIHVGAVYDAVDAQTGQSEYSQHLVLDSSFHILAPYFW